MALSWERLKDERASFAPLQAALLGPLVLAGLTYADRRMHANATLRSVPPPVRAQLRALVAHAPPRAAAGGGLAPPPTGCLVSRWASVWVVGDDGLRRLDADCALSHPN